MSESTMQIVPISLIELIIYNSNVFSKFIRNPNDEIFLNLNIQSITSALIQYMDYVIKNTNTLGKDIFDRINYICDYYKLNKHYDFEKYLEKTQNIVSLKEVEKILNDEDTFNKFIDFENNKSFFKEDISEYLYVMEKMFLYYDNSTIELTEEQNNRYKKIMEKYSLKLKKYQKLEGYETKENLDEKLVNEILKNVDLNEEPFILAYSLYIELSKRVSYDVNFSALNQKINNETVSNIYNKNINNINLNNNKVVCKTWAELYQKLLTTVGIRATVTGDFHKYVLIDCDGTLIKADATYVYSSTNEEFKMNDITRVKLGIDTVGFTCIENNKNIDLPLNEARKKINLKEKTISDEIIKLEEDYNLLRISKTGKIIDKLNSLFSLANNSSLDGMELLAYMLTLTSVYFKNNNQVEVIPVYKKINNEYIANMLFTIKDGTDEYHILYEKNKPILKYSSEQIIDMLNSGILSINEKKIKEVQNEYTTSSRTK